MLNDFFGVLKLYTERFVDFREHQVLRFLSGYKTINGTYLLKVVEGFLKFGPENIRALFKGVKIVIKLSFDVLECSQFYFTCFV